MMKHLPLAAALALLLPTSIAQADCESDKTEILKATAASAPIRRISNDLYKGKPDHTVTRDFSPPDQIKEISVSNGGTFVSTVLISGKTAWSMQKDSNDPPTEFDGSGFLPDTLLFRIPPAPATDCNNDGSKISLIWKSTDGRRTQQYTAIADAKTHVLQTVDGYTKDEKGNMEEEEHVTFAAIPAFTITPPAGAKKLESGPTYAKISDVDPMFPMPPDADKITYDKGHLLRFDTPQKTAALVEFYKSKFVAAGWKEDNPTLKDNQYNAAYRSATKGWFLISIGPNDQMTRVQISGPYKNK